MIFSQLGERDLWSSHEARAAQNAVAVLRGQWVLPRLFDGRYELQKPPLYYWLIAAWCRCTESTVAAFAVRLPAAISALITVLALIIIGYVMGRPVIGIVAASFLLTMPHFLWLSHVGRIDLPLTACLTVALTGKMLSDTLYQRRILSYLSLLITSLALSLGLLLKGPIILAFYLAIILADSWSDNIARNRSLANLLEDLRKGFRIANPLSVIICLTCMTPVFLWYMMANEITEGQWVREFFFRHNFARGFGGDPQLDRHRHWLGPLFYLAQLPWSIGPTFLLAVFLGCKSKVLISCDNFLRLSVCWFMVPLILLSLMQYKRLDYLAPAYPGFALAAAILVMRYWQDLPEKRRRAFGLSYLGFLLTAAALWLAYLHTIVPILDQHRQQRDFAAQVREYIPPGQSVLMFCTEAHLLSFHLGGSIDRVFQESELRQRLQGATSLYVIVPKRYYDKLRKALPDFWVSKIVATNERNVRFSWLKPLLQEGHETLLLLSLTQGPEMSEENRVEADAI
ncbi:MAG: glycosyltransferase family 39 protein [Gemmatales bacterium]|nr:glycosyltransferase family 39 protein [Gemmatales bacterium]